MKKQHVLFSVILTFAILAMVTTSCKKDNNPATPKISTLMAGDFDLNGAVPPSGVSTSPVITATFNVAIDAASVTSSAITLTQDYDSRAIPVTLSVNGKVVTITPQEDLGMGALYVLEFTTAIQSTDGLAIEGFSRSFTTEGAFAPSGALAYWNFENNADDQILTGIPVLSKFPMVTS
jgi:hypothetical protein